MTQLRSALYLAWFFGLTAVMAVAGLAVLPFGARATILYGRCWTTLMLFGARAFCGLGYRVEGLSHLPAGAVIIAAKHQSAFETVILPHLLPDACFVLKQELTRIPIFGWYLRRAGHIAVDRRAGGEALRAMLRQAEAVAAQGRPIIIFPEGTRTAPGEDRLYQPGVAALYKGLGVPVVPVALDSGLFWKRKAFVKLPGTATLKFLPAIQPGLERKAFMRRLKDEIERESAALAARDG